jgi:hypothetical protein
MESQPAKIEIMIAVFASSVTRLDVMINTDDLFKWSSLS